VEISKTIVELRVTLVSVRDPRIRTAEILVRGKRSVKVDKVGKAGFYRWELR